jgi:sugar (pentulose or hexulose) kinase
MAKSKLLREILANTLNMNVVYIGGHVSAEVGSAYIAGNGVGLFESYEVAKEKLELIDKVEPDPKINEIYEEYYERVYKNLHPALAGIFNANYEIRNHVDKMLN